MSSRSICIIFALVTSVACGLNSTVASPTNASCVSAQGQNYGSSSAAEIEKRLQVEASKVSWTAVPESYRKWAADQLALKVSSAASTLAASAQCQETEAAAAKIASLANRIAEVAKKCTDEQCLAKHAETPAIEQELGLAICPLYPFC